MNTKSRPTAVIIAGPTASGKSGLAMRLAGQRPIEIISADSAQVYRGFDIGTAKPTTEEQERVRHHFVDCLEPHERCSAGEFAEQALAVVDAIVGRGALPVVVGGTGLWIRALLHGVSDAPPRNDEIRDQLRREVEERGSSALHRELTDVDPETAERVHPNDTVRIIRALEVYRITGTPMSEVTARHDIKSQPPRLDGVRLALLPDRDELYKRINARVEEMLTAGWVEEVEKLLAAGVDPEDGPLTTLGYRTIVDHLLKRGENPNRQEMVRLLKRDHRRYAKRQYTWFRRQLHLTVVRSPDEAWSHLRAVLAERSG